MEILAGRPTLASPYEGVQQCIAYLVFLGCFVRWEASSCTTAALGNVPSRVCLKNQVAFLSNLQ